MIKNIIFDLGGVLVDFHPDNTMRDMGLSNEQIHELQEKAFAPLWSQLDEGILSKEEIFAAMIQKAPEYLKNATEEFLTKRILDTVSSLPYSAEWLKSLKAKGYGIYLLTNYPDFMFSYHWEHTFTFTQYVDGKIVSGVEKLIKPDHRIYRCLMDRYGLVPSECVFTDDRLENIEAAKETSLNAVQFTNYAEVARILREEYNV